MENRKFLLDIGHLLKNEVGSLKNHKINGLISAIDEEIAADAKVSGQVNLIKINDQDIEAEFTIKTWLKLSCCRCLNIFQQVIRLKFNQIYSLKPNHDEDDYSITANTIDLEPIIREEIITHLPLKPLCKDNCQGIKGLIK